MDNYIFTGFITDFAIFCNNIKSMSKINLYYIIIIIIIIWNYFQKKNHAYSLRHQFKANVSISRPLPLTGAIRYNDCMESFSEKS